MPDTKRRGVVLTTDCGADIDDQWVVAHLAVAPEVVLRGIVTTHAPNLPAPAAEASARAVREVFDHLPVRLAARPPILPGSSVPLGADGKGRDNPGVQFLRDSACGFSPDNRLTVLVIGAATDAASALLLDPTLAERMEIVAMGFDGWPEGGDPWNVKNDPRAWQTLLRSPVPVTIGDAKVTARDLTMTRAQSHALLDSRGLPGEYLARLFDAWLARDPKFIQTVTGRPDAWPLWDAVAVAHLLGLTTTETHPRPALRDDLRFAPGAGGVISWVTKIDAPRLWAHFAAHLDRVGKAALKPDPRLPL